MIDFLIVIRRIEIKPILFQLLPLKASTAFLSVDSENQSALSLYDSIGFELHRKTLWYEKKVS